MIKRSKVMSANRPPKKPALTGNVKEDKAKLGGKTVEYVLPDRLTYSKPVKKKR